MMNWMMMMMMNWMMMNCDDDDCHRECDENVCDYEHEDEMDGPSCLEDCTGIEVLFDGPEENPDEFCTVLTENIWMNGPMDACALDCVGENMMMISLMSFNLIIKQPLLVCIGLVN